MQTTWIQSGNTYRMGEITSQIGKLPNGVYKLMLDPFDNLYLSRISDNFEFKYKIYDTDNHFVDRVKKTFDNTVGNLGILLNGVKGTGKTVTAQQICNKLELPVIIVPFHHNKLVSMLNDIQQDVIVFVDEYEKIYDGYENSLLTIMDGALKTINRIVFLFTTNELRIDRNLLQRPSRVRYIKTYSDLSMNAIMEIVNDLLINKSLFDQTIKMISELQIITIDIVKAVVEEVNIHNEDPFKFKAIFNLNSNDSNRYNVYKLENNEKVLVDKNVDCNIDDFSLENKHNIINYPFLINGSYKGTVKDVIDNNQILVAYAEIKPDDYENGDLNSNDMIQTVYLLERYVPTHRSFYNYAF